jgi:hypothetical protein
VLADVSDRHLARTILELVFGCEVVVTRPPSGGKRLAELSAIDPDHDNQVATYQLGFHPSAITVDDDRRASG